MDIAKYSIGTGDRFGLQGKPSWLLLKKTGVKVQI